MLTLLVGTVGALQAAPFTSASATSGGVLLVAPYHGHFSTSWGRSVTCGRFDSLTPVSHNVSSGTASIAIRVHASTSGCPRRSADAQYVWSMEFASRPLPLLGGPRQVTATWNLTGRIVLSAGNELNHSRRAFADAGVGLGLLDLSLCSANPNGSPSSNCTVLCAAPGSAFLPCWSSAWHVQVGRYAAKQVDRPFAVSEQAMGNFTFNPRTHYDVTAGVYVYVDVAADGSNESARSSLWMSAPSGEIQLVSIAVT